jgi:preprotein translocase subunit SecD
MIQNLRLRLAIIAAVFLLAVIWTVPNFVNTEKFWWPTKSKMVLGLDIQGGSHLVLRVDVDSAIKQDTQRYTDSFAHEIAEESKVTVKNVTALDPMRGLIKIEVEKPDDAKAVGAFFDKMYPQTFTIVDNTADHVSVEFKEMHLREFRKNLLDQAIGVIRNRIDEFGVAEPSITAQGSDRILVQLPGIKDASTAKDLINRTARLDFMMVSHDMKPEDLQKAIQDAETATGLKLQGMRYTQYVDKLNEALKGKIPENTVVFFEKPENAASLEVAKVPYLLKTTEIVTGSRLTNAQVGMDQYGKPIVQFKFDPTGARQFADLTRKHVKEQMAIVLDKVVKSAPAINEPITQGSGQITLGGGRDYNSSVNEAKLISTALRAGALPATLEQLEERTVGPSLGKDAIEKGKNATLVAAGLVFIFMIYFYRGFGVIADVALAFNLLIVIAVLSTLGATLTLPGVAGMALTLGISVDANVIIYERIKEEMSKGASLLAAIKEGYDRAFSSIFDANVTSVAVCVVLMYYGTGPVRGFAVTLLTGLLITTFTAVFFTRAVIDLLVVKWKWPISVGKVTALESFAHSGQGHHAESAPTVATK